jgi:hypothetical protein
MNYPAASSGVSVGGLIFERPKERGIRPQQRFNGKVRLLKSLLLLKHQSIVLITPHPGIWCATVELPELNHA